MSAEVLIWIPSANSGGFWKQIEAVVQRRYAPGTALQVVERSGNRGGRPLLIAAIVCVWLKGTRGSGRVAWFGDGFGDRGAERQDPVGGACVARPSVPPSKTEGKWASVLGTRLPGAHFLSYKAGVRSAPGGRGACPQVRAMQGPGPPETFGSQFADQGTKRPAAA